MAFPKLDSPFVPYIGIELYALTIPVFCVIIQPIHHELAHSLTAVFLLYKHIVEFDVPALVKLVQQPYPAAGDQPLTSVDPQTLVSAHRQHRFQAAFQFRYGKLPLVQFVNQGYNGFHLFIGY